MMASELNPEDLASLADLLRQRRAAAAARLESQLEGRSRAEHAREVLLEHGSEPVARETDREVDLAQSDKDTLDLQAIDDALARLAQGRYGRCADCDEPIALARLRLEPQARYCIECAARRERGKPRPPSM